MKQLLAIYDNLNSEFSIKTGRLYNNIFDLSEVLEKSKSESKYESKYESVLNLEILIDTLEYNNKYWGGLSYRLQDAVVVLAGINISGGLSIGYSYDLPTTRIITVSSGSHEVLVMYSFEYMFGKRTSRYKSIRIL